MRLLGSLLALGLVAVLPAEAAVVHVGQPVMGTILEVTIVAAEEARARRLADAAIAEARHWDDVLTTWRPDGELALLNAKAGKGPVAIGADLAAALTAMQRWSATTGGAFDPAVGRLVRLWSAAAPPPPNLLQDARRDRIESSLRLDGQTATLAAGVALDAGGIGKGIALDAIALLLRREGVRAAFLDFGGSSQLAIGSPPDAPEGWRVLVAGLDAGAVGGLLALRDAALSTSRARGPGAKEGPIIDPRRGEPVTQRRVATVLANDATSAEAWSTAFVVLGRPGVDAVTAFGRWRTAGLEVFYADPEGTLVTDKLAKGLRAVAAEPSPAP